MKKAAQKAGPAVASRLPADSSAADLAVPREPESSAPTQGGAQRQRPVNATPPSRASTTRREPSKAAPRPQLPASRVADSVHRSEDSTPAERGAQKQRLVGAMLAPQAGAVGWQSAKSIPQRPQQPPARRASWFEITEDDNDDFFGAAPASPIHPVQLPAPTAAVAVPPVLGGLPVDAWSQVLLFNEVSAVGQVAATCAALRNDMWEDSEFWSSYAGPNFAVPSAARSSPSAVRLAFRRWVHGLEGCWGADFAATAPTCHHADVFDDAARLLAGLRSEGEDMDGKEAAEFARALISELGRFDAACGRTRDRACEVVVRARAVEALLPAGAAEEMREAFEASVERAHAALFSERPKPEPSTKKPAVAAVAMGKAAAQSLASKALLMLWTKRPAEARA